MQTRHLKTLVQIARVESFATAASQLNMTLSTLSMQMKTLEEELQVSLLIVRTDHQNSHPLAAKSPKKPNWYWTQKIRF